MWEICGDRQVRHFGLYTWRGGREYGRAGAVDEEAGGGYVVDLVKPFFTNLDMR